MSVNRYPNIVRAVYSRPWAMEPSMLALVLEILAFRVAGGHLSKDEIEARIAGATHGPRALAGPARANGQSRGASIAVIPVYGVISQRQNLMAADSGGTSIESLTQDFREAMSTDDVAGVVFDVDSPGGTIDGVAELAAEIRASRGGDKPIVAVANSMAASAAYWLASAADEVVVTPSGSVGSIGVFAAHEDLSVQAEQDGVKTTIISAGKFKAEGNPWEPLTDEARAHLQEMVDSHYGMFIEAVAEGRGAQVARVRGGYGEGRIMLAKDALAEGMVDRVDTLDSTITRVARGSIQSAAAPAPGLRAHTSAFNERLSLVSAEATDLLAHARNRAEMRATEDRTLTPSDRAGLRQVAESLLAVAGDEPVVEPTPEPARHSRAHLRLALARAQYNIEEI